MPNSGTIATILITDDDAGQRSLLESYLTGQGYRVETAKSAEDALARLKERRFALLISDVRMPGMSGLEMLGRVRHDWPDLPVLMVTAFPDIRGAVEAMRDGALNYLEKPIDFGELIGLVRKAVGKTGAPPVKPANHIAPPEGVIAESPAMLAVIRESALAAPSEVRILITGESGVGKEVVADLVHRLSKRAAGPLVKVNCAAIPENLLESELFGHERGSFTGASNQRIGRFEEANGGTILLDEIGEMSPGLQAKLLRVIEDGSFQRVGSNRTRHTDSRLLASTNRDLESEVASGRFREDLFFRLNVLEIHVPPLRERSADIIPLAHAFAKEFGGGRPRLAPATIAQLEAYSWPGNVRELRNAMERAVLMAHGDLILPEHLPRRVQSAAGQSEAQPSGAGRMDEVERAVILQTLRENGFNRSETARALGISRRALLYKLQRYREQGFPTESE
ncbi:sigma-54 dependent transcriptional regulator [bacterium]|nr:sigma-54 dependent transcriptional regulator [bacterium]